MNSTSLATIYKARFGWTDFFKLVSVLGTECNDRKSRFDKADILEQAIESVSDGTLRWVDDIGRDHRDIERNLDIEFKFSQNVMFNEKHKPKKTVVVKLKNSLGASKTEIQNPADFYMIAQQNAVAIISYEELKPYITPVSDGISTNIPHDKLTFIVRPDESEATPTKCAVKCNYLAQKRQMQQEFIKSVINSTN